MKTFTLTALPLVLALSACGSSGGTSANDTAQSYVDFALEVGGSELGETATLPTGSVNYSGSVLFSKFPDIVLDPGDEEILVPVDGIAEPEPEDISYFAGGVDLTIDFDLTEDNIDGTVSDFVYFTLTEAELSAAEAVGLEIDDAVDIAGSGTITGSFGATDPFVSVTGSVTAPGEASSEFDLIGEAEAIGPGAEYFGAAMFGAVGGDASQGILATQRD